MEYTKFCRYLWTAVWIAGRKKDVLSRYKTIQAMHVRL